MSLDVALTAARETAVFEWDGMTHNMTAMADAAGIYRPIWRPVEVGITHAAQLIEPLRAGLAKLEGDPEHYRQFNPPNGWGDYDGFVEFVRAYLQACEATPDATVSARP